MKHFIVLIIVYVTSYLLIGCKDFKGEESPVIPCDVSQPISFIAQVDLSTRGTPVTDVANLTDMGVYCAVTSNSDWNANAVSNLMFNEQLSNNSGTWTYADSPIYWDASELTDRYSFFAYTPYASIDNGITVKGDETTQGKPTLSYTVPSNVVKQPDLMVAVPRYNLRPVGNTVSLQMKHALTAVGFKMAGYNEKVVQISITGVSVSGDLVIDGSNIQWSNLGSPTNTDYSALINFDQGQSYFTATPQMTDLITGNGYLMMIPQVLGADAKLKITFDDNTTRVISLNAYSWVPGARIMYQITNTGIISTTSPPIIFPSTATTSGSASVICRNSLGVEAPLPWTLTVEPPADTWLKLSLYPNGSGATATLSGAGSQPVYFVLTQNNGSIPRATNVLLNGSPSILITQLPALGNIYKNGTLPASVKTYVGAFWRANETGERIIRLAGMNNDEENRGPWTVSVVWQDAKWSSGDSILLSKDKLDATSLSARGITWNKNTENPNQGTNGPENHKITAGTSTISGVVDGQHPDLIFRVGLKNVFSAYHEFNSPARYAVVLLTYGTPVKVQKFFIRQGQGADVVSSTRTDAKWPPYNLSNSTSFMTYPTQAGYFYQWRHSATVSTPWPHDPITPTPSTWPTASSSDGEVFSLDSACPTSYTVPTGSTLTTTQQQSLLSPADIVHFWGYYADGFFDRRETVDAPGGQGQVKSAVSKDNNNIAYMGMLVYSNITNASLFFPAAGYRVATNGALTNAGNDAMYMSRTVQSFSNSYFLNFWNSGGADNHWLKSYGFNVRCVRP